MLLPSTTRTQSQEEMNTGGGGITLLEWPGGNYCLLHLTQPGSDQFITHLVSQEDRLPRAYISMTTTGVEPVEPEVRLQQVAILPPLVFPKWTPTTFTVSPSEDSSPNLRPPHHALLPAYRSSLPHSLSVLVPHLSHLKLPSPIHHLPPWLRLIQARAMDKERRNRREKSLTSFRSP